MSPEQTPVTSLGPIAPTPHAAVALRPAAGRVTGGFWAQRRTTNADISIADGPRRLEEAGNLANFRAAADTDPGHAAFAGDFQFQDSDVYKWLEAAGWQLADSPTPDLAAAVEQIIAQVGAAQRPDGYLQTYYQLGGGTPWTELGWGHELYCAGHLMQAAVAHHRATGGTELLDVAVRFADHIAATFGPGAAVDGVCGHPQVETALVELYRTTGGKHHLDLARYFLDRRGHGTLSAGADRGHDRDPGPEFWQDHLPILQADEVVGHAVRQLYLLAGAADLAIETGDTALTAKLEALWQDMAGAKTSLTGGVGARYDWEAFGDPYELPADRSYNETCAAIASVHFSWRMALLTGRARYSDLIERTLYNGFLSGVGLDGLHWLYVNPLHRRGRAHERPGDQTATRTEWFRCACCPPNAMRLLAGLPHYFATHNSEGFQLHQYATGVYGSGHFTVRVATRYPWEGRITATVEQAPPSVTGFSLRIPAWCDRFQVKVNGAAVDVSARDGWVTVSRAFAPDDTLVLDLGMPVRFTRPDPRVDALRGMRALERGPLVYCLEDADQIPGLDLEEIVVDPAVAATVTARPNLLGGVNTVTLRGRRRRTSHDDWWPYRADGKADTAGDEVQLTAVPYGVWGNRDSGAMRVWLPERAPGTD
ncbi:glycoside hydrolase family 127 protein [Streptomyces sp. NPDC051016]|uniref:glycoside hydrolase family 127 protein n=1 Tax=Streptomyces sp. NPDC051016 TaxID=3365638 RepID=UPI00379AE0B6